MSDFKAKNVPNSMSYIQRLVTSMGEIYAPTNVPWFF